ncbi:MAG: DUF4012 domain-containing protein [Actinomycetota bacterium]|nr:DUF4012 domain-containing protein [Actinomycetota bacterium]
MGEDLIPGPGRAHVGEYAIVERLGTDRSAERFRARRGVLRTDVLIRVLTRELESDSSVAAHMQAKAEAALGFRHPNVVTLLDYGWDGGRFFWVSEWTEAESLDTLLSDHGLLGAEAAVEIALDVSLALEQAHSIGLVHGDIASGNVLLSPAWDAQLSDLGIAAPFVVGGRAPEVADDIYAVGALLGEMLTGSMLGGAPPGTDPLGGRPLSPVAPSAINPDVPPEIDALVLRTLASDPWERFETAGALHSALSSWRQSRLEGLIWGEGDPSFGGDVASPLSGHPAHDPEMDRADHSPRAGHGAPEKTATVADAPEGQGVAEWGREHEPEGVIVLPDAAVPRRRVDPPAGRLSSGLAASTAMVVRRVLLATLLILFVDSVYVVGSLPFALGTARAQLDQGVRDVRSGSYGAAEDHFVESLDDSNRAVGVTRHPPFLLLASLPWVGRDPSAMGEMATATRLAALAGVASSRGFIEMGAPEGGPPAAVFRNGTVRLRALEDGAPFFARSRELLEESLQTLEGAPDPYLGFVGEPLRTERAAVEEARASLIKFDTLAGLLPSLTGLGTERRYLFVVQGLGRARGSGGALEYAGVLQATDGRLSLESIEPIESLPEPGAAGAGAPDWFIREYGPWGALDGFSAVNFSPRFASVAAVLLDLYAASTGETLDGVIAVDSAALGGLTSVTGPLTGPGYGAKLGESGAARLLDRNLFGDLDEAARDGFITGAVRKLWSKLNGNGANLMALPSSLIELTRKGHLKVYSRGQKNQAVLEQLGAAGDPSTLAPNVQMVFHNNLTSIPVDSYMKKSTDTHVQLTDGAEAAVFTAVTLDNGADPALAGWLGASADDSGLNRMRLSWLLPKGATVHELKVDGESVDFEQGDEGGHPLVSRVLEVPGGSSLTSSLAYTMTAAAGDSDNPSFDLALWPQPAVDQGPARVTVVPPDGATIAPSDGPGQLSDEGVLTVTQSAGAPLELHLDLLFD